MIKHDFSQFGFCMTNTWTLVFYVQSIGHMQTHFEIYSTNDFLVLRDSDALVISSKFKMSHNV